VADADQIPEQELDAALAEGSAPKVARRALATLAGVPFVGGLFGAAAGAWSEGHQKRLNEIFAEWLKLQQDEIREMEQTLFEVLIRLDPNDEEARKRVESSEYHSLVKKCFRDWSAAESEEKRRLIRNLLANAAATRLTSDDVLRLFIEWIANYSELHFKVIKCVHANSGITRYGMWHQLHGESVREDSAEADLFKLVVQDLSMGHIIRQDRETDSDGHFYRKRTRTPRGPYMQSAFDNEKAYILTNMGRDFVHYTMNEIVPKIGATEEGSGEPAAPADGKDAGAE